jgi:hypothetical protein
VPTTLTSSALPFVSVENSGVLTTVTPSGAAPPSPSSTGLGNSTGNANATAPACTSSNYALDGEAAPFCLPANGTAWIQNTSQPVTWNPDFWPDYQGTVVIALIYTGADGSNVITQVSTPDNLLTLSRTTKSPINEAFVISMLTLAGSMVTLSWLLVYSSQRTK